MRLTFSLVVEFLYLSTIWKPFFGSTNFSQMIESIFWVKLVVSTCVVCLLHRMNRISRDESNVQYQLGRIANVESLLSIANVRDNGIVY